jgi:hypothetical protein
MAAVVPGRGTGGAVQYRHEFGKGGVVDPAAVPGSHPGIN